MNMRINDKTEDRKANRYKMLEIDRKMNLISMSSPSPFYMLLLYYVCYRRISFTPYDNVDSNVANALKTCQSVIGINK